MLRVNFCDSRLLYCGVEDSVFGTIESVREPSTVGWQTLVWSIAKWLEILPRLGSSWLRPERWTPTSHEPRNRFTFLHRPFSATTVHRCLQGSASLWAAICQCQMSPVVRRFVLPAAVNWASHDIFCRSEFGRRTFSVAGSMAWVELTPWPPTGPLSSDTVREAQKTYLFAVCPNTLHIRGVFSVMRYKNDLTVVQRFKWQLYSPTAFMDFVFSDLFW